jgi:DNA replication protein DnaC
VARAARAPLLYWPAAKLLGHHYLRKADGSYLRGLGRIARRELLILDDFALEPLNAPPRIGLLETRENRHGRASTLIANQLPVAKRHETIGEPSTADADCDRMVHAAERIELKGGSVRKLRAQRTEHYDGDRAEGGAS